MRGRMEDTAGLWDVGGKGRRRRGRDGGRFAECQAECQAECHGGSAARSVRHVTEIWSRRQRKASPSDEATAGERHERRHSDSADAGAGRTRGTKESDTDKFLPDITVISHPLFSQALTLAQGNHASINIYRTNTLHKDSKGNDEHD